MNRFNGLNRAILRALVFSALATAPLSAGVLIVGPSWNPYLYDATPIGDGVAPTAIAVPGGSIFVQFTASGDVSCNGSAPFNGPDGSTGPACSNNDTDIT